MSGNSFTIPRKLFSGKKEFKYFTMSQITKCAKCKADIMFLHLEGTEKSYLPVNVEKQIILEPGSYLTINDKGNGEFIKHKVGDRVYINHIDTCPYGDGFKRYSRMKKNRELREDIEFCTTAKFTLGVIRRQGTTLNKLKTLWERKDFQSQLNKIMSNDLHGYRQIIKLKDNLKEIYNEEKKERVHTETMFES